MSQATKNRHCLPEEKGAVVQEILGGRIIVAMGEDRSFYRNSCENDGSINTERISRRGG